MTAASSITVILLTCLAGDLWRRRLGPSGAAARLLGAQRHSAMWRDRVVDMAAADTAARTVFAKRHELAAAPFNDFPHAN